MRRAPVVVIAVGNEMRGDDAAGVEASRYLEQRLPEGVELARTRGDAAALLELWRGRSLAVVVDAVSGGGAPGEVLDIDALGEGLPAELASASTHDFGLAQGLELGRLMGALPQRLRFVGIVGARFGIGDEPSAAVLDAVEAAVEKVIELVQQSGEPDA